MPDVTIRVDDPVHMPLFDRSKNSCDDLRRSWMLRLEQPGEGGEFAFRDGAMPNVSGTQFDIESRRKTALQLVDVDGRIEQYRRPRLVG